MIERPVPRPGFAAEDVSLALFLGVCAHLPIVIAQCSVGWNPPDYAMVDEFGFSRAAIVLERTGHLDFGGWVTMTLVGLLWWARPFIALLGPSFLATRIAAWTLNALGPAALFLLLRQRGLSRTTASLAALALGWSPLYTLAAAPFMTDAPYLALCLVGALFLERALLEPDRAHPGWTLAGALAFVAAGSIRQTAVLGLAAALLVAGRARLRGVGLAILVMAGILIGALYQMSRMTPGFLPLGAPLSLSPARLLEWPSLALAIGMSASPLVLALPVRHLKKALVVLPILAMAWVLAARANPGKPPGFMGTALGPGIADPLASLPLIGFGLLVLSALPFILSGGALVRGGVLEALAALHGVALLPLFASRPLFDRYGLPLAAALVAIIAMQPQLSGRRLASSLLVMGVLSTLSLETALHDKSLEWDLGRGALARGIPAHDVAIDFTWAGFHGTYGSLWQATQDPQPSRYRVTLGPEPEGLILERRDRSRWWRPGFRGRYRYFYLVDEAPSRPSPQGAGATPPP